MELWVRQGCLLQVTAQSLSGDTVKAKRSSEELMQRGMVHFVASDAHDTKHRPTSMNDVFEDIQNRYGPEVANAIFEENPRAVLEGTDIQFDATFPLTPKKKRWSAIFSD